MYVVGWTLCPFTNVFRVHMLLQGNCLDTLARKFLWDVGHRIGVHQSVDETPLGELWRVYPNDPGLQKGMFLSNGKRQTDPI
jgi:hypothetical protein